LSAQCHPSLCQDMKALAMFHYFRKPIGPLFA
jgi:hypothetical protein